MYRMIVEVIVFAVIFGIAHVYVTTKNRVD